MWCEVVELCCLQRDCRGWYQRRLWLAAPLEPKLDIPQWMMIIKGQSQHLTASPTALKTVLVMEIHKSLLGCWPLERDRGRCFASLLGRVYNAEYSGSTPCVGFSPSTRKEKKSADRLYSTANKLCWLLTVEQELDTERALCRIQAKLDLAQHEEWQRDEKTKQCHHVSAWQLTALLVHKAK